MSYIIFTAGSCRGDSFQRTKKITKTQIDKFIKSIGDDNSVTQEMMFKMGDELYNLFENQGKWDDEGDKYTIPNFKKRLVALMKKIDKGLIVTNVWEEGTTGIAIESKKNKLITEVKMTDYDAMNGEGRGNLHKLFKLSK